MYGPVRFTGLSPRLPVLDIWGTLAFYRDALGFAVGLLWPSDTNPTFLVLERDDVRLQFYSLDERASSGSNVVEAAGEGVIIVETSDVRALHDVLAKRVVVEWGPEVYTYGRREFAVRDPTGYLIIFSEETDEPATQNEPG